MLDPVQPLEYETGLLREQNGTHIRGEKFRIPAIACVMRHLIEHVLSEANLFRVGPNLQQEQVDSAKKISHGLGANNFLAFK